MRRLAVPIALAFLLASCASVAVPTPTPQPPATRAPTLVPTSTPAPTLVPTSTAAPTCHPGTVVKGVRNDAEPAFVDIIEVTTELSNMFGPYRRLKSENIKIVFTVRSVPDQITINRPDTAPGNLEIAWGVAVDLDNSKETGGKLFWLPGGGIGYDNVLQAFHFHAGSEKTGDIPNLLKREVDLWTAGPEGIKTTPYGGYVGVENYIQVDTARNTITLGGNVPGITQESYLTFFAYYNQNRNALPSSSNTDVLCGR